jgi:hypothetical protein
MSVIGLGVDPQQPRRQASVSQVGDDQFVVERGVLQVQNPQAPVC